MATSYIVQSGDVLLIPSASTLKGADTDGMTSLTIEWQQSLSNKKASYHTGFVQVKGKPDERVLFFIASEWYTEAGTVPGAHISKIATKVGDFFEFKVDDKARYGQKNARGEARFIVYHDISRNPYQYRFMNPALRVKGLGLGQSVAKMLGVSEELTKVGVEQFGTIIGDPLRKF